MGGETEQAKAEQQHRGGFGNRGAAVDHDVIQKEKAAAEAQEGCARKSDGLCCGAGKGFNRTARQRAVPSHRQRHLNQRCPAGGEIVGAAVGVLLGALGHGGAGAGDVEDQVAPLADQLQAV